MAERGKCEVEPMHQHPFRDGLVVQLTASLFRHGGIHICCTVPSRVADEQGGVRGRIPLDQKFDAGIRLGELVADNMVAVKIGPDLRLAVVAAPGYVVRHGIPKTPRDLAEHTCINFRLPGSGGLYAWQFRKGSQELKVRVGGQLVFNDPDMILAAAADGHGIACLIDDHAARMIQSGRLVRLLEDWCPPFSGYHLYYPTRKNNSAAFRLLVEQLRAGNLTF